MVSKLYIEDAVFALLKTYPDGIEITQALDLLAKDYDYLTARETVWRLLNQKQLRLEMDRKLFLPK